MKDMLYRLQSHLPESFIMIPYMLIYREYSSFTPVVCFSVHLVVSHAACKTSLLHSLIMGYAIFLMLGKGEEKCLRITSVSLYY